MSNNTTCWWEEATWPATVRSEIDSDHFEDIRRRIFLLDWPNAGYTNILTAYGKPGDTIVPYDHTNWAGSWDAFAAPSIAHSGDIIVLFKGQDGVEDLYVNYVEMGESVLDRTPPLNGAGVLAAQWRLAPNPNLYHHWDHNAGRPEIGASGRWIIIFHPADIAKKFLAYTHRSKAYLWLPRQVGPYRQIPPVKYPRGVLERHQSVELLKDNISKDIGTAHARTLDTIEPQIKPQRQGEYVLSGGEPDTGADCMAGSICQQSNQCACDLKFSTAYQARVIKTCEGNAARFLKVVDEPWIENWTWAQDKLLWALGNPYTKHDIVYLTGEEDETLYVCIKSHNPSTTDNKPGSGVDWETYWGTPAYNPTFCDQQHCYAHLAGDINMAPMDNETWLWGCNDSAFELLLREIGAYDWWWDASYPCVPYWLYKWQFNDPASWPLPRGCWRRTWRHSAGRVGTMMWPGEKGDPPGYDSLLLLIVTQSVYDAIPEGNQKWYTVSDVENLHEAAYGPDEEQLIAERHDPVETRHIEYYDEKAGQYTWAHHPLYELHHDLVNDIRDVLLLLHLIDSDYLDLVVSDYAFQSLVFQNWGGSSAALYNTLRTSTLQEREDGPAPATNPRWWPITATRQIGYHVSMGYDGAVYTGRAWHTLWEIQVNRQAGKDIVRTFPIASVLTRVLYFGYGEAIPPPEDEVADGCVIGYEGFTIYAAVNDMTKRYAYVRLELSEDSTESEWYFDSYLLSPWPATGRGEYFDFNTVENRRWRRWTQVDPRLQDPEIVDWCVFDIDWCKISSEVFAEAENIAIVID